MVATFAKRPASPLDFESAPFCPEDVVCYGSEEEDSSDEHRSKRHRRFEAQGKQYLDGRPLFIQSASLKGPFDQAWVNPWARKQHNYRVRNIRQIPEAVKSPERGTCNIDYSEPEVTTAKKRSIAETVNAKWPGLQRSSPEASPHAESVAKRRRYEAQADLDGRTLSKEKSPGYSLQPGDHDHWLKRTSALHQARFRSGQKSPTPTPAPRQLSRPLVTPPPQSPFAKFRKDHQNASSPNQKTHDAQQKSSSNMLPPEKPFQDVLEANAKGPAVRVRELSISNLDRVTRRGVSEVKNLSQEAVKQAEYNDGYQQARLLSQEAAARNSKSTASRLAPYVSAPVVSSKISKATPHALPPSTYQPAFEYRYARKTSSESSRSNAAFVEAPERHSSKASSESISSTESSADEEPAEAVQARPRETSSHSSSPMKEPPPVAEDKADLDVARRLSFTLSGNVKLAKSRPRSRPNSSNSVKAPPFPLTSKSNYREEIFEGPDLSELSRKSSEKPLTNGKSSRSSNALPEAQVVPDVPVPSAQAPSGPSTNLLETDDQSPKLPSLDEGDSLMNLSTQAAILKAQRSFQDDVLTYLRDSPKRTKFDVTPKNATSARTPTVNGHRRDQAIKDEPEEDAEPMSTQDMVDAMSPFAVTTVKKRTPREHDRSRFVISPTKAKPTTSPPHQSPDSSNKNPFTRRSLSMSTSPSPAPSSAQDALPSPLSHPNTISKTPSSLTSFSILPNGTVTETSVFQDGQQPVRPELDYSLPDLDAAIRDAGSFLGNWDVEAEAKREGQRSAGRSNGTGTGPKGILAGQRGSG